MNNTSEFTDKSIIDAINNINKQIKYIKSVYKINNVDSELDKLEEDTVLNNIQNSIETVVESIEPVSQKQVENKQEKEQKNRHFLFAKVI